MSNTPDGNTPLDDDERDGLIPAHLQTRIELNQWEALNIAHAHDWLSTRRKSDVLSADFLKALHKQMFGKTWRWAGKFRRSDKNISPHHWANVSTLVNDLTENTRAEYAASDKSPAGIDNIATRFHHQLVHIHPWPNGNGRHARLATDVLLAQWGRPPFTWGGADLTAADNARSAYTKALQKADAGDFKPLSQYVRS